MNRIPIAIGVMLIALNGAAAGVHPSIVNTLEVTITTQRVLVRARIVLSNSTRRGPL